MFDRESVRAGGLEQGVRPQLAFRHQEESTEGNGVVNGRGVPHLPDPARPGSSQKSAAARLEVKALSWGPPRHPNILDDIDFHVEPGDCLNVIGPNGAGKSTLLRLIYRFHRPKTGEIKVDGKDVWDMSPRQVARQIAVVLQENPVDFALTAREVVALGRTPYRSMFVVGGRDDGDLVDEALVRMRIRHIANRGFATLSGGERQRAMVARALVQEPRLIVLDEPTNHLDIRHQLEVLDLLKSLGITVVCSLHDLNTAMHFADSVLFLSQGRSLAFGRPDEILKPDLVSEVYSVKAQAETLSGSGRSMLTFHL